MLGLVDELCARGPLALFLDDLQWADSASLLVLDRLMRSVHQLLLLVVGACLPVPRVPEVEQLSRSLGVRNRTVLRLAGLSAPAVGALMTDLCGAQAGPRLRRMAEGAAGNPLYVSELVAALLRDEAIGIRDGVAEIAAGTPLPPLTTLITHRLRHLRDEVLQTLRVASVLDTSFTITDLAALLGTPVHTLLGAVVEAEAAGVLRDTGDRLAFRHDLVRHALYDAVPGSARALLHLRAAQALAGAGAAPERTAAHLLDAASPGGPRLASAKPASHEADAVRVVGRDPADLPQRGIQAGRDGGQGLVEDPYDDPEARPDRPRTPQRRLRRP